MSVRLSDNSLSLWLRIAMQVVHSYLKIASAFPKPFFCQYWFVCEWNGSVSCARQVWYSNNLAVVFRSLKLEEDVTCLLFSTWRISMQLALVAELSTILASSSRDVHIPMLIPG